MRAVVANVSTPRYVLTAAAQKVPQGRGKGAGWGPGGIVRMREVPDPVLPAAPGWLRLRPELAGICGSDIGIAHAKSSFVLSAFYRATLQVLGHEFVAVVDEVGPGVSAVQPGDRVVADPVIACRQRGFDPACRACAEGRSDVCERFDEPGVRGCSAPTLGFGAALGGGLCIPTACDFRIAADTAIGGYPEVNLGTGTMDRNRWASIVDSFIADLSAFGFLGRQLDVRENVKSRGGQFGRWTHENFPHSGCVLSIEFKKFFMDEWTGVPDPIQVEAIERSLQTAVPGVLAALRKI